MKKLLFLIMLLCPVMVLWAQSPTENPKQRITEVKQAEDQYIYADQTSVTVEKAVEQAQELLLREVLDYLQQSGETMNDAASILKDQMVTITVQRGDKFRAFVYIDKQFGKEKAEAKQEPEKVVEIQKADSTEASIPVNELAKTESVVPVADTSASVILQQIGTMTTRLQVYDYITQLQKEGEKVTFVSHPNAEELESMYILLYKRGGAIEAILTPPDGQGKRYNLATGLPDAQANHPSTSINGFILE